MERRESECEQRSLVTDCRNCILHMSPVLVMESQSIRAKGISAITVPNPEAGRRFGDVFRAALCVPKTASSF